MCGTIVTLSPQKFRTMESNTLHYFLDKNLKNPLNGFTIFIETAQKPKVNRQNNQR